MDFGNDDYAKDVYVVGGNKGTAYFVDGGGVEGLEDFWLVKGNLCAAVVGTYLVGCVGEGLRGDFFVVFVVMDEG